MTKKQCKSKFVRDFGKFVETLNSHISTDDGQWTIKGFIDIYRNVYTISSDTKIVSKILEIHLFPQILKFAEDNGYRIVLPKHQNYYPDLSFVSAEDEAIKFAVDLKTTYRLISNPKFCNGFTLGSHGMYFTNRNSTKNIQFPYSDYSGHFCLGIIYSRADRLSIGESKSHKLEELHSITSVIRDFKFFVVEKWRIASDKSGSGNTANIGSIKKVSDIIKGNGVFHKLGESWFDDYWMNYRKITIKDSSNKTMKIANLEDFVKYRDGDCNLIVPKAKMTTKKLKKK